MVFEPDSSVLVIFCRRPRLGEGKQRIAATAGQAKALTAAGHLLDCALEDAAGWSGTVVIAPARPEDEAWANSLIGRAHVVSQPDGTLGERIQAVDKAIRARGGRRVVFIGSDAPSLTAAQLQDAERSLQQSSYVLAPAEDGGVVLLGSSQPWPELSNLPWETEHLASALAEACVATGAEVVRLPTGRDVDTEADLRNALDDLMQDPRPARQRLAQWVRTEFAASVTAVIPVHRDTHALEALLSRIRDWREQPDEIIVVDGDHAADCARVSAQHGARYLTSDACRGLQSDSGARAATGNVVWFLHADSEPASNSIGIIREHVASHVGGYFDFRFAGDPPWFARALELLINIRTRIGMPYGDQGLFVRRDQYLDAGGIEHAPLFEEVQLIRRLRKAGKFAPVGQTIGVSTRRWERDGWIRRSVHNRYLALAYQLGIPAEKLALSYRNENR